MSATASQNCAQFKMTFQVTKETPWGEFHNYSAHENFMIEF